MFIGIHVKYPLFLSDFNKILHFLTDFLENSVISNLNAKSIRWKPSCSMWMDGQAGMAKLIVTFHNFANMPNNRTDEN